MRKQSGEAGVGRGPLVSDGSAYLRRGGRVRSTADGTLGRVRFVAVLAAMAVVLGLGVVGLVNTEVQAAPGTVAPVQATYHGVKPYHSISSGVLQYDAWTYGDIVFYSPPGKVTQEMANQWLAWYATTDDILRALINDDAHFEGRFRGNDPNFGRVKVIGTPPDSCGAGCGNKQTAEGVGIIDNMVAEPDNFEHHWILFYEQARGGVDETFDLAASWPRENYHLPHLAAAFTYYEIGGMEGLQRGVPGGIYNGLQMWADLNRQYVDQFVEREQRWFDDPYPDGSFIYPPQTSMLLHIGLNDGYGTLGQALSNAGQYPDNFMYDNSTDAICDWQAAVNDATGGRYADRMVDEWGLPGNCPNNLAERESGSEHPNDLRFEASGFCAEPNYKPGTAMIGHFPCDGSADQKFGIVNERENGTFSVALGADRCLDASGVRVVAWSCHGASNQMWQWNGDRLEQPESGLCVTANTRTRWGGGLLSLEPCSESPTQRINTDGPPIFEPPTTTVPPPTTAPTDPTEPTVPPTTTAPTDPTVPSTTVPPTTTAPTDPTVPSTTVPITTPAPTKPPTTAPPKPDPEGPPTTEPPVSHGLFALVNVGSGRCVDQPWSQDNGGNAIQWRCAGHTALNQLFRAAEGNGGFTLAFTHSNKCLDEWDGNFYQWACHGGENQLFNWNGSQLQVKSSGLCLTVEEDSLENGANIYPAPCVDSPAQQFRVERYGMPLPVH